MTKQDEFEDFVVSFIADYTLGGRGKNELISFLKAYPLASAYLVNEIIEHLENLIQKYSESKTKKIHCQIYNMHITCNFKKTLKNMNNLYESL